MKKIIPLLLLLFVVLFMNSCSSPKKLEGNWETNALIKDGVSQQILVSNINFIIKDGEIKAKGDAGVNLYNAKIKIKGKSFFASNMENTGFQGKVQEMEFEDMFFTAFMNADSYKIDNDVLYLYAPSSKMELQLKRKVSR